LTDREVGKQTVFLKDITYPATMCGGSDAALGVHQHPPVDDDASSFRADQSGDCIDDRGLTRSRSAEQRGETAAAAKMNIEVKSAEPMLDVDLEYRAHSGGCRSNGIGGPSVISCIGWFRLKGDDNEGQNRILRTLKL